MGIASVSRASNHTIQQRHPQQKHKPEELSPTVLRSKRLALKLSQSELGRRAGVSRPKICIYELGGPPPLNPQEQRRIRQALHQEAERLRNVAISFEPEPATAPLVGA
jgi:transcriptional regulator with XRE-family HTH domain